MKQTLFSWLSDKPKSILFIVKEIYMNRTLHNVILNFRSRAKKQDSNSDFPSTSLDDSEILLGDKVNLDR